MTPNREDYIKAIYSANISQQRITNKMIAQELGISAPSVSEMLNKLVETDRVAKDDVLGYVLTKSGILEAQQLIRKHRLWEVFLVEHLGYSWDDVHDDAEILEHATSEVLADRLNSFLGNPEFCPHGGIIYGNGEHDGHTSRLVLDMHVGEVGIITEVGDHKRFLNYLVNKGIHLGMVLKVLAIDEYDQSRTLLIDGKEVWVTEGATQEIYVRRENSDEK